ncbi:hypothetical protein EUA06_13660 [Nocardioides glacieisoli]|uniref:Uncharacterized protein n=1 Tax=Nocardioides glacieisoli TaxID=1168730 RepID=A0A4Q2RPQ8_9ACTN|nr:hypothetical protein [Nocardioides glacieisoli]RYB89649.1 hypothetical protein EUA06_13660 [Nocardioides glacieisoli]
MTTPGVLRAAVAAALVLAVAGCGEREPAATATEPVVTREGPVTLVDGEVLLSCGGGPGWVASTMAEGTTGVTPRAEIEAALDEVATDPDLRGETARVLPQGGRTPWKLLVEQGDQVVLALGDWTADGPARDAMTMHLERTSDGWRWTGHGNCWTLGPVLDPDTTWVQVNASAAVDGDATEVTVDVNETACTSARDPAPFLDEPALVSSEESVTVYWTSQPPVGGANCPGNPTSQQMLILDEPLGDRPLLDGSRWPPALVGQDE